MAADIASFNNNVYDHLTTMYAPLMGVNTKYDTHKKSELRGIYNSIVEKSKESPVFLLDTSRETKNFAVSLKESARNLKNTISSLSNENEEEELLSKKTVYCSDTDAVDVKYIGDKLDDKSITGFNLIVDQLASSQKNTGTFLPDKETDLPPDTYSFDVHVKDTEYEFQFNIGEGDTNKDIQEKLVRLINRSNIGVKASIVNDERGNTALALESEETGLKNGSENQFRVSDDHTSKQNGAVDYFGIDRVTSPPTNAEFRINGMESSSATNHFTVANSYDLTLKEASGEGGSINIGLKTDVESITDNINYLIGGYNSFIRNAAEYLESQPNTKALMREMHALSLRYGESLGKIGINFKDDGTMDIDTDKIRQTADDEDALSNFSTIKSFATSVLNKANEVSLDPMQYTMRKVVEYKNPGHTYATPYVTSNYSGMMFSGYC